MLKHRKSGDANASRLSHLLAELAKKISNSLGDPGERATEVPGLMLYRRTGPTVPASQSGHAIGLISRGSGSVGFDPNNGYYKIEYQRGDGFDEYDWLKKKTLGARLKHSFTEVLVYGCS